ncbi:chain-length determining protein [uncultured Brevundimonas sp.]|uniref:chain-length determining protein n=1 Tax=uncultured Brevundimonas sp. TaxID=213418 RepID=UPI0025EB4E6E|nr:chain-length determining protein [uncultured Brevundimonas sp.]
MMSESVELKYIGGFPSELDAPPPSSPWWRQRIAIAFAFIVLLPTAVAAVYFLLIASPRYVSEARFVVRKPEQQNPAALGLALSGVGLSTTATDAFVVHEFIRSRAGVEYVGSRHDLAATFSPAGADPFSRAIKPWQTVSGENVYKGVEAFITVGYDATTGISTLRVQAFSPKDAEQVTETLLRGGEGVVNALNHRSSQAAVLDAERSVTEAQERLNNAQQQLTDFRSREQLVDPGRMAIESSELIGGLLAQLADLQAQRRQLQAETPDSPLLATLNQRIAAYQQQVEVERTKIAGSSTSLAPKIGTYETLVFDREVADRSLAGARQALETARIDARRQQLFLDRVVQPNLPDQPTQPRRLLAVLAVLASTLLIFGCGYLVWAGVREHNHE